MCLVVHVASQVLLVDQTLVDETVVQDHDVLHDLIIRGLERSVVHVPPLTGTAARLHRGLQAGRHGNLHNGLRHLGLLSLLGMRDGNDKNRGGKWE